MKNLENNTYQLMLAMPEWKEKRNTIVKRDFHRCQACQVEETINEYNEELRQMVYYHIEFGEVTYDYKLGEMKTDAKGKPYLIPFEFIPEKRIYLAAPIQLHVHHTYYIKGHKPWEYPDEALKTLCADCHMKVHEKEKIPFYENENRTRVSYLTGCAKCRSTGYLPEYSRYFDGVCFDCAGAGYVELGG